MNILWVVPSYPSSHEFIQGIFLKRQAEALASLGVHITILAPVPWIPPLTKKLFPRLQHYRLVEPFYEEKQIEVYRPRYFGLPGQNYWSWGYKRQFNIIKKLSLSRPDFIHAHFAYPQGLIARQLSRLWKLPYMLTLHGGDVNVYPRINRLAMLKFTETLSHAYAVLAVSKALADEAFRLSGVQPTVMSPGIKLELFKNAPSQESARSFLNLPKNSFIVLYVGGLTAKKGILELVTALKKINQNKIRGMFVGSGPLLSKLSGVKGIICVGPQENEKIPLYLSAANLLVLPSHTEGLPTILMEAGAAGTPALGTKVGGIPELLAEERGYLVPPKSVEELSKAIVDIQKNYTEALIRAKRLQQYILEYHDMNHNAKQIYYLYQELLKQPLVQNG